MQVGDRRRAFTDDDDVFWEVREAQMSAYDRRGGTCLIFESINCIRRVRDFPPDWFERSDEELQAMSRRA